MDEQHLKTTGELLALRSCMAMAVAWSYRAVKGRPGGLPDMRDALIAQVLEFVPPGVENVGPEWIKVQLAFEKSVEQIFATAEAFTSAMGEDPAEE
ncbi:hypothetical protein D9X30_3467 [Cupriavidus sp. U2]|uniref:hypothetical protein n=1 Tax=Cupriavidus sp. U2 TaxID=2920269 RepID=UPI00129DA8E2|nr:hypothetical protein [Cupriavidus sp. U2]KAI3591642.1 hypothetical protein D9X30_3467 [Cupriavidus sp. U2]